MPRNPSGVYSLPPVYQVSSGDDILPDQHNTPLEDLEAEQNATRSVATGGTGGSTPQAARTALELGEGDTPTFAGVAIAGAGTVDGRDVSADGAKLDGIETGADVTDAANVEASGALMDSEVSANLKTLTLPANTTISNFGALLAQSQDGAEARTTLSAQLQSELLDGLGAMGSPNGSNRIMVSVDPLGGGASNEWQFLPLIATVITGGPDISAVIERGSNANGEFTRYYDGTLICWNENLAATGQDQTWTFPQPFSAVPAVTATARGGLAVVVSLSNFTNSSIMTSAYNVSGTGASINRSVTAIGRWS